MRASKVPYSTPSRKCTTDASILEGVSAIHEPNINIAAEICGHLHALFEDHEGSTLSSCGGEVSHLEYHVVARRRMLGVSLQELIVGRQEKDAADGLTGRSLDLLQEVSPVAEVRLPMRVTPRSRRRRATSAAMACDWLQESMPVLVELLFPVRVALGKEGN